MKRKVLRFVVCFVLILSMAGATLSAMAAPKVIQILKVTVDYGRLREGPTSDYAIVDKLYKGERVFYLNQNSGAFCKVCTADGHVGYIYRGFLQAYGAARADQIYCTARDGVKVYKSVNGKSMGSMPKNTYFMVYKTSNGWGLAKSLTGATGYVKMADLNRAN